MKSKIKKIVIVFLPIVLLVINIILFSYCISNKNMENLNTFLLDGASYAILLDGENFSSLPTNNAYLVSYECSYNSKVEWDRLNKSLKIFKNTNVTEGCTLNFKTKPLLSEMNQGDYVAYIGNNGCMNGGTPITGSDEAESGNSCLGENANSEIDTNGNTYGYCDWSNEKYYVTGWRIAYTENNRAYLISAGSPECNIRERSEGNMAYINLANSKAKKYCNSSYVDGDCSDNSDSWAINDNDFYKITSEIVGGEGYHVSKYYGNNNCYLKGSLQECGYNNDLIDNGGYYWFAASYAVDDNYGSTLGVSWLPRYHSTYSQVDDVGANGLRPVIRLSASVYVTGGSGTMDDPYTIAND